MIPADAKRTKVQDPKLILKPLHQRQKLAIHLRDSKRKHIFIDTDLLFISMSLWSSCPRAPALSRRAQKRKNKTTFSSSEICYSVCDTARPMCCSPLDWSWCTCTVAWQQRGTAHTRWRRCIRTSPATSSHRKSRCGSSTCCSEFLVHFGFPIIRCEQCLYRSGRGKVMRKKQMHPRSKSQSNQLVSM